MSLVYFNSIALTLSPLFIRLRPHALSKCGRRTDSILNETTIKPKDLINEVWLSRRSGKLLAGRRPEVFQVDLSWGKIVSGLRVCRNVISVLFGRLLRLGLEAHEET